MPSNTRHTRTALYGFNSRVNVIKHGPGRIIGEPDGSWYPVILDSEDERPNPRVLWVQEHELRPVVQ